MTYHEGDNDGDDWDDNIDDDFDHLKKKKSI